MNNGYDHTQRTLVMSATCDDVLLMEGSTNAPDTGNGSWHPDGKGF